MEPSPHLSEHAQMILEKGRQPKKVPDEQWLRGYWDRENKLSRYTPIPMPKFERDLPREFKPIPMPKFERDLPREFKPIPMPKFERDLNPPVLSPEPKGRYQSYLEDQDEWNKSKGPLSYKDWLRMTRWRYEKRNPNIVRYNQDDPEWWRTNKNNRQRAK